MSSEMDRHMYEVRDVLGCGQVVKFMKLFGSWPCSGSWLKEQCIMGIVTRKVFDVPG